MPPEQGSAAVGKVSPVYSLGSNHETREGNLAVAAVPFPKGELQVRQERFTRLTVSRGFSVVILPLLCKGRPLQLRWQRGGSDDDHTEVDLRGARNDAGRWLACSDSLVGCRILPVLNMILRPRVEAGN